MHRIATLAVTVTAVALFTACAAPAPPVEPAADPTAVSSAVSQAWETAKLNISESAGLAEADFSFRPVDDVRSIGETLAHIAGANYVFCSAARGEESPHAEDDFEQGLTSRDEIVAALAESLAYCDEAYAAATDASLAEAIALPFGGGDGPRAGALIGNTTHLNEHYGNLVTYFRIQGIVPPSSRR